MIKKPKIFIRNPVDILKIKNLLKQIKSENKTTISVILKCPDVKIIALFGVATGRQNAKLTANVNGNNR